MFTKTGKLLVIEGLEGAGKTSAIQTVINLLASYNITTVTTREPGGTGIGEILRSIIKSPEYKSVIEDKTELLLLYAARIQLLEEVIKPELEKGFWVIADRFELSTFAYQGGGRGIDKAFIRELSQFCLNGFKPDLTLFLDISPEQGMQRVGARGQFDRIEQQAIEFFHRVHAAYMECIEGDEQVERIDATVPIDRVQANIQQVVRKFIEQQGL